MYAASYDTARVTPPFFYRRRLEGAGGPAGQRHDFRDPSLVFGGGVHVRIGRHWALRPEAEVTIVLDGGHAYGVTAGVLRIAYRFGRRQITPAGR
jgi:hypothetical protein